MAALTKGKRDGEWRAYYWDRTDQRQRWVPAEVTRAWTGLSQADAQARLEAWAADAGVARVRARSRSLLGDDRLAALLRGYAQRQAVVAGGKAGTRRDELARLRQYGLGYFVGVHGVKDVRRWAPLVEDFPVWLREAHPDLSAGTLRKVCQALRGFGEYLVGRGLLAQPWLVRAPRRPGRRTTPLVRAWTPTEVLALARQCVDPRWRLAVLAGYFCSLRPEEIYALTKEDWLTGDTARREARTHRGLAARGLGSGLAVGVNKARTREGLADLPKTHYAYGTVMCWSVEGARALAATLKELPAGPVWGELTRWQIDREWREWIQPLVGGGAQDLRRASGLWLGRTAFVELVVLQEHMRHADLDTTLLYTRRPGDAAGAGEQNLDDVG